ncbi:MAG TPA: transketolase C-terminal domain-containing protein, partial [Actinomycetales bacterium]|nr:transketolase C-terminal domain-containing protein [Actinomycetales bacterium]
IVLTRQNVPTFERGDGAASGDTLAAASGVAKGAYVLAEARNGQPQVLLLATGSEVQIALEARTQLEDEGIATRVVSIPSKEWFADQSAEYREEVLPVSVRARVSVEAGVSQGWREFVGDAGRCVSLEHYGASADFETLFREFGFTPEKVVAAAKESLADTEGTAIPGGPLIKQHGGTGDRD